MRFVYRPKHPQADEFGMVPVEILDYEPLPSGPNIISDSMPMLKHHGTGQHTDSKFRFRQMTKACGGVELGNDPIKPRQTIKLDKRQRREDIAKTVFQLRNGIK